MNVYVLIHHDHHADDEIHVYKNKETAVVDAMKRTHEFDRFNELKEVGPNRYYVYKGTYSCEGDHVRVEEKILKE